VAVLTHIPTNTSFFPNLHQYLWVLSFLMVAIMMPFWGKMKFQCSFIFSCIHWPFIFLLMKIVCSVHLLIYWLD
jgi:hypothetical protein